MSEQAMLITAISTLVSAIVALAVYIVQLHRHQSKEQKENLIMITNAMGGVTTAMTENKSAIDNNTRVVDKLFEHISNLSIKKNGK